ncbi:hypothetical protein D9757_005477 [Collybiopsis confluens]|uniref:Small secreted protein n=1 Tax=Collybiopsis confluens TaxID=2823264 RepID=A0A8H5HLX6_9AGAR|nr:hypothetical protein D9757_005477 [Collybiopsis confluens]
MLFSPISNLLLSAVPAFALSLNSANTISILSNTSPSRNTLLANAIVGKNNASSVECWAVEPGFQISPTTGNDILQLGNLSGASYSQWPNTGSPIDLGFHNAPAVQWVLMIVGGANITFPDLTTHNLTVSPGELFIAADVAGTSAVGHRTVGDSGSIVLQMPFQEGTVVNHIVVNEGTCH